MIDHQGFVVFHGLSTDQRDYCVGFTIGHDDGIEGESLDSAYARKDTWFGRGYRAGYKVARFKTSVDEDEQTTLLRRVQTLLGLTRVANL